MIAFLFMDFRPVDGVSVVVFVIMQVMLTLSAFTVLKVPATITSADHLFLLIISLTFLCFVFLTDLCRLTQKIQYLCCLPKLELL